jgi:hypothetical protein
VLSRAPGVIRRLTEPPYMRDKSVVVVERVISASDSDSRVPVMSTRYFGAADVFYIPSLCKLDYYYYYYYYYYDEYQREHAQCRLLPDDDCRVTTKLLLLCQTTVWYY